MITSLGAGCPSFKCLPVFRCGIQSAEDRLVAVGMVATVGSGMSAMQCQCQSVGFVLDQAETSYIMYV